MYRKRSTKGSTTIKLYSFTTGGREMKKAAKSVTVNELFEIAATTEERNTLESLLDRIDHKRENELHLRSKAQREKVKKALEFYEDNFKNDE
jgi:hypothetical protein